MAEPARVDSDQPLTLEDLITENRRLWDLGDEIANQANIFKRERKELGELILGVMVEQGIATTSVDGVAGCSTSERTHYRVSDREVFLAWLKENPDAFYLLKLDFYADKIREYVNVEGEAPPGSDSYTETVLNMRRK